MENNLSNKLQAANTIGIWILVFGLVLWLVFKKDNTINTETIDKLTVAVEKMGESAKNLSDIALAQRDWANNLERTMTQGNTQRDVDYAELAKKYGYENANVSLDSLYGGQLQQPTKDNGGGYLRRNEDGVKPTSVVQDSTGKSKEQSH